ncbi:hypothetical protein P7K49_013228 [Saguinus oedipus]|uniref:Anoctamin n=1 Tax=Saguinus oedipus TaxID=9490 RepID=A0ABQ9VFA8_SAGOE|nr:hypothetical protein P7K49_013228 [Saguinus oedipus]
MKYRAFRDDDGHYSQTYWNLLAIRLAFVIVFELHPQLGAKVLEPRPAWPREGYSGCLSLPRVGVRTFLCSQHVVFSIGRVLDLLVPDIPESVQTKVKREYYLAKQALAENEVNHTASPGPPPSPPPILVSGCCTSGHQVTSLFLLLPFLGYRLFLEQTEQRMSRPRAQRQVWEQPGPCPMLSPRSQGPAPPPTAPCGPGLLLLLV